MTTVSETNPWRDADTLRRLYWDEGLSLAEVPDRLGCSDVTVMNWMERHDIPRRERKADRLPRPLTVTAPGSTNHGYELVWTADAAVRHHRLLMVAEHGFDALDGREVHHRNRIPWDNRPENLALVTPEKHERIHGRERRLGDEPTTDRATTRCPDCGDTFLSVGTHWNRSSCAPPTPSDELRRYIDGLVLGDGHVNFSISTKGFLNVQMTNRPFVEWVEDQLGVLSTGVREKRARTDSRKPVFGVRSRSLDWFDRYRDWYEDGSVVIPETYSLSREAARAWYVSDGSVCWSGDSSTSVRIACSELVARQEETVRRLFTEQRFDTRIGNGGIAFRRGDGTNFLDWIGPSLPGFAYKWETDSRMYYDSLRPD